MSVLVTALASAIVAPSMATAEPTDTATSSTADPAPDEATEPQTADGTTDEATDQPADDAADEATDEPAADEATDEPAADDAASGGEGKLRGGPSAKSGGLSALTVPGMPGTPQAPTALFVEDFDNAPDGSRVMLDAYTGAAGTTYGAEPDWVNPSYCNGFILDSTTPYNGTDCNFGGGAQDFGNLGELAQVLGLAGGSASPTTNGAVAAYTDNPPVAGDRMLQSQQPIALPETATGRFITLGVDVAAENCPGDLPGAPASSVPQIAFSIYNSTGEHNVFDTPINGCAGDPYPVNLPTSSNTARGGSYVSNGSSLYDGDPFRIVMRNLAATGGGNDSAFDNIRVLDVTPQLDKEFSPSSIQVGGTSTLTLTVTNTDELGAKNGWSFTDNLPSGLTATGTAPGGTCDVDVTASGSTIAVTNGNLAAGEESCTITVEVTSPTAASYDNCAANISDEVGINDPACATVEFVPPTPFQCTADGLIFQSNPANSPVSVNAVDLVTGDVDMLASAIYPANINAVGYNVLDDFIYGVTGDDGVVVRISADGTVERLGLPAGITAPFVRSYAGEVDENGQFWVSDTNGWQQIDLATFTVVAQGPLPGGGAVDPADWAYVPGGGNYLYTVAPNPGGGRQVFRFDRATKQFAPVGQPLALTGDVNAMFADADGFLYASTSAGPVYRIDVLDTVTATLFTTGPVWSQSDGTMCADATIDIDFGDAPDSFDTTLADDGPRHRIVDGLHIGSAVDVESDGQPTPAADGDGADEDAFPSGLVLNPGVTSPTVTVPVTNTTGGAATLYGWIDADNNGSFEASEFASIPVPDGVTSVDLAFAGIPALQDGTSPVVRLRLTTDALTDDAGTPADERALGAASNGEVEDHLAQVATVLPLSCAAPFVEDFGAGAGFGPELPGGQTTYQYIGSPDPSGQMDANHYAVVPSPMDVHTAWYAGEDHTAGDTDGRMMVVNASVEAGIFFQRTFTGLAPGAPYDFSAWIANVVDQAVGTLDLPNVTFRVVDPATGNVLAEVDTGNIPNKASVVWERFALQFVASQATVRVELVNNTPGSAGNDLAIDDIALTTVCEFGDAPDSYGTLLASTGAGHVAGGPTLGIERDTESDGQPNAAADGDNDAGTAPDDEDGVATPIEITVGRDSSVSVSATNDSDEDVTLAGWIDLDGNGTFDAGERQTVTVLANSGTASYPLDFPAGTTTTDTYARFRIFGQVVADPQPTGIASAGEVEDYQVTVLEPDRDFGDAPASFGTDLAGNGPRHVITPGLNIGSEIDVDPNGQPGAGADGDDTAGTPDDEDAFSSTVTLNPGATAATLTVPLTNTTGGAATLSGWIDANGNGTFEPSEFASIAVPDGATTVDLAFAGISPLQDGAKPVVRLRLTTDTLTDDAGTPVDERALGAAADGEVEDHLAQVATQVPVSCVAPFVENFGTGAGYGAALPAGQTTYGWDGAQAPQDGIVVDGEYAIIPALGASAGFFWHTGLDHTPGDTDGRMMVVNASYAAGIFFQRTFTGLSAGAVYDFSAWITNGNNINSVIPPNVKFRVVDPATGAVLAEANTGDIPNKASLVWERFGLQFTASQSTVRLEVVNNGPGGDGNDLALDDISFAPVCEFGDAPDSYGTLLANNGAGHVAGGPTLGTARDTEADGQPSAGADGDNAAGTSPDDEDGVAAPIEISVGAGNTVSVSATNDSDEDVTLAGWIDLDGNGTFDNATERVLVTVPANTGTASYDLAFAAGTTTTNTYARFRIFGEVVADPQPTGIASAGEVEDYPVTILPVALEIEKTSNATADSRPGDEITYTVTAENTGTGDYTAANPAHVWDDLSGVLDDATLDASSMTADRGAAPVYSSPVLSWTGELPAGETVTITYTVTLTGGGDGTVRNVAFGQCDLTDPDCDPVTPVCNPVGPDGIDPATGKPCAAVESELPKLSVTKTADSSELAAPGETVTYTVTVTNEGPGDYTAAAPATMTDDMTEVLDDTSDPANITASVGTATYTDPNLTWTGVLAAGASATITYDVTYTAGGDQSLVNDACVPATEAQDPLDPCASVEVLAGLVEDGKSVVASDDPLVAGSTLTYSLTFENVGQADAVVDKVDNLLHVLDDGDVTTLPTPDDPALTVSPIANGEFSVTGTLTPGQKVTVTYVVTLKADGARGDNVAANFLVPPGTDICDPVDPDCEVPDCLPADGELPDCTVTPIGEIEDGKSVVASDDPLVAGSTLTYTLTFENIGGADAPVNKVDNLLNVLDDGDVTSPPTSSDPALTISPIANGEFSVTGTLTAGQKVTVTYVVTLKLDADRGDNVAANFLVAPGTDICDPTDPSASDCELPECTPVDGELPDCTVTPIGEIEDGKSVVASADPLVAGSTLTYTLTFENIGGADAPVNKVDNLLNVLDDGDVTTLPTADDAALTVSPIANGELSVTGTLTPGQVVTVTYVVTLKADGERGDNIAANFLVAPGTDICDPVDPDCELPECVPADGELPDCTVTLIGEIEDGKSVVASADPVVAGTVLTYTLTFENVGEADAVANKVDNLLHVLDDGDVTSPPVSSDPALTVSQIANGEFSITGTLVPDQVVTVTYEVTLRPDGQRGDDLAANFLVSPGEVICDPTDPSAPDCVVPECLPAPGELADCTVTAVGEVVDGKSVVASDDPLVAGSMLTYTLTFENTGQGPAPVSKVDNLLRVLDDGDVTTLPTADDPALTVSPIANGQFAVTGTLQPGQKVTVTYVVTLKSDADRGDNIAANFLVTPGTVICDPSDADCETPECVPADGELPDCTTTLIGEIEDWKSVSPASTTPVVGGQELTYTLTFTNRSKATGVVNRVDDLTHVLDDAAIVTEPQASDAALSVTRTDNQIAITGDLAVGQTVTVTYTVKVKATGERGDDVLANFLINPGETPPEDPQDCGPAEGEDADCTVNPIGDIKPSKIADPKSGTTVTDGRELTYTLSFQNVGKGAAPVDYTDHMAGVLDDAQLTDGPTASDGLTVSGPTGGDLHITGEVPAGATATVTYTVKVADYADQGDHRLGNFLTVTGEDPPAECVAANPLCTEHPTEQPPTGGGWLPRTGAGVGSLLGLAMLVLIAGGVLVISAKRRRESAF